MERCLTHKRAIFGQMFDSTTHAYIYIYIYRSIPPISLWKHVQYPLHVLIAFSLFFCIRCCALFHFMYQSFEAPSMLKQESSTPHTKSYLPEVTLRNLQQLIGQGACVSGGERERERERLTGQCPLASNPLWHSCTCSSFWSLPSAEFYAQTHAAICIANIPHQITQISIRCLRSSKSLQRSLSFPFRDCFPLRNLIMWLNKGFRIMRVLGGRGNQVPNKCHPWQNRNIGPYSMVSLTTWEPNPQSCISLIFIIKNNPAKQLKVWRYPVWFCGSKRLTCAWLRRLKPQWFWPSSHWLVTQHTKVALETFWCHKSKTARGCCRERERCSLNAKTFACYTGRLGPLAQICKKNRGWVPGASRPADHKCKREQKTSQHQVLVNLFDLPWTLFQTFSAKGPQKKANPQTIQDTFLLL